MKTLARLVIRHHRRPTWLKRMHVAGFSSSLLLAVAQVAHAENIAPPAVPANLQVPAGNSAYLEGHAGGTQDYICLPCPNAISPTCSGFAWAFFGPQATLFDVDDGDDKQIITHFLSPDLGPIAPEVAGTPRATWQHSRDTSTVWAKKIQDSTDASFVQAGAIPWFLLQIVGSQSGPTGGDKLTATTYIQRVDTTGGVAPATVCDQSTVGKTALVPYSANYFFFKADQKSHRNGHDD